MVASHRAAFFLVLCAFVPTERGSLVRAQMRTETQIVTNVELVQIPVTIFDDKGAVATNLRKSDFRLFDDGIEQNILYFERERVPVSFVILADLSSSMTRKIPFVQEAAVSLLDSLEEQDRYHDEYSILGIGRRSKLLMPFTSDERDLERRLPLLLTATGESTSLFDGIWLGVSTARRDATNQHRAMIIITDGGDNHSRYNLRETRELLEEADVPVFAVMAGSSFELPEIFLPQQQKRSRFPSRGAQLPDLPISAGQDYIGPAERRGPHNMKILTEVTGGGVFTAHDEEDLPRIVRTIGLAVRYRYVLTYKPNHESNDSRQHKVVVQLYPQEKFRGYSVPYYKRSYHSLD